jgi:hypothetical protein
MRCRLCSESKEGVVSLGTTPIEALFMPTVLFGSFGIKFDLTRLFVRKLFRTLRGYCLGDRCVELLLTIAILPSKPRVQLAVRLLLHYFGDERWSSRFSAVVGV